MPKSEAVNDLLRRIYQVRNDINEIKSDYLNSPDIDYVVDSADFDDIEDLIVKLEEQFEAYDDNLEEG